MLKKPLSLSETDGDELTFSEMVGSLPVGDAEKHLKDALKAKAFPTHFKKGNVLCYRHEFVSWREEWLKSQNKNHQK